jgi:SSS family solute:Na+ symporter
MICSSTMSFVLAVASAPASSAGSAGFTDNPGLIALALISAYMLILVLIGCGGGLVSLGTAKDYFTASHSIGPLLLLFTIFGTTMTSFAIIGSSGEAYSGGIGVYGLMVSWSGLIHSLCFFLVGIKLWAFGRRYGYQTQIEFFRDRFESKNIGLVLFPALVGLVVPYLLTGLIGGGNAIYVMTAGALPQVFKATNGAVPFEWAAAAVCLIVLIYVFFGGARGTTWVNVFQTIVFILIGAVTLWVIAGKLGGAEQATANVVKYNPTFLQIGATEADHAAFEQRLADFNEGRAPIKPREPEQIPPYVFLTYCFIPLSVAMFPHLFQHWLTAKSARSFRLSVVAHPILMMIVWLPCVMIGVWATSALLNGEPVLPQDGSTDPNKVLPIMVKKLVTGPWGSLLTAAIASASIAVLDSQFLAIGSMFTHDIAAHYFGRDRLSDRSKLWLGRSFIVLVAVATYVLGLKLLGTRTVFALGVWCFTGYASLSPIVFASLYWKRTTKAGVYACALTAAAVGLLLFALSDYGQNRDYYVFESFPIMPVAVNVMASTAALIIVSLMTRPPTAATIEKFFPERARA